MMYTNMNKNQPQMLKEQQADAETFYNMLMWDIEPELTTDMLPELDLLYAEESPEDRMVRLAWYTEAFELLKERAKELKGECKDTLQKAMKKFDELRQMKDRKGEMNKLSSIEDSLAQS